MSRKSLSRTALERPPLTAPSSLLERPPLTAPDRSLQFDAGASASGSWRLAPVADEWDTAAAAGHAATSASAFAGARSFVLGGKLAEQRRPHSTNDLPALSGHHQQPPPRAVLGAQFRGYGRAPPEPQPHQCTNCMTLNSKLHRVRAESSDLRQSLDHLNDEASASAARVKDLQAALAAARDELAARSRQLQSARESEASARADAASSLREEASEWRAERGRLASEAATAVAEAAELRQRLEASEKVNERLRDELAAASGRAEEAAASEERRRLAAAAGEAAEAEAKAAAEQAAATIESLQRTRDETERLHADLERERARSAALEIALSAARAECDAQGSAAASAAEAASRAISKRDEALDAALEAARVELRTVSQRADAERRGQRRLAAALRIQRLQRHKEARSQLVQVAANARRADAERLRAERVSSETAAAAAAAEAAAAKAAKEGETAAALREEARQLKEQLAAAKSSQRRESEAERRERSMREILSAVKIAVLAPCLKLHVNGLEPRLVGSADQVDFGTIGTMLEAEVLSRCSRVHLLADGTTLEQASARDARPSSHSLPRLHVTLCSFTDAALSRSFTAARPSLISFALITATPLPFSFTLTTARPSHVSFTALPRLIHRRAHTTSSRSSTRRWRTSRGRCASGSSG